MLYSPRSQAYFSPTPINTTKQSSWDSVDASSIHPISMNGCLMNQPYLIGYLQYRFLLCDAPSQRTLPSYLHVWNKTGTSLVVRAGEFTYDTEAVRDQGITLVDLNVKDGQYPSSSMLSAWLSLVNEQFGQCGWRGNKKKQRKDELISSDSSFSSSLSTQQKSIAVHCTGGGVSSLLVSVALLEAGMEISDVIRFLHHLLPTGSTTGSTTAWQMKYLTSYQPSYILNTEHRQECHSCSIC